jgi:Flp pilus assembly protein TadG
MKTSATRFFRRTERGGVAVEAALILPVLILFLAAPLFAARVFWYYSVAEKAAHDGARFLSSVSRAEIQASTGGAEPGVAALAKSIADDELDEIKPALVGATTGAQCDFGPCGGLTVPQTVRVTVQVKVRDDIFGFITDEYFGEDGLLLTAAVTMRYAGN